MRVRIQKLLASRGVGSRRQVEAWIASGRVTVNGKPASPGAAVTATDDIRLDGRRLRLARGAEAGHHGLVYHRPPQEALRPGDSDATPSSIERLPRPSGRRWIPVSPLPPRDGGLELFVTDGELAAALTRRASRIPCEFSVRVRGAVAADTLQAEVQDAASATPLEERLAEVSLTGGEGSNRWIRFRGVGLRARDLRELLARLGLEANRVLRSRYGPIAMDRALSRGRHRRLTDEELGSLRDAAGLSSPAGSRSSGR